MPDRLDPAFLGERLDELLDAVLSSRRTSQPLARALEPLPRRNQDFVLHWIGVIARSNPEMAYQFAALAPLALERLGEDRVEAWIIAAMDVYDREGLYRASAALKDIEGYRTREGSTARAVALADVRNVLELFVRGLSGRRLRVDAASEAWTDTETIHLPATLHAAAGRDANFLLYKAMAAQLWAQSRYGTFNVDLVAALDRYPPTARALDWFCALETRRLDARIAATLPGLARDLGNAFPCDDPPIPGVDVLARADATVADTLALLPAMDLASAPPHRAWDCVLRPGLARDLRDARLAREKQQLQAALRDLADAATRPGTAAATPPTFSVTHAGEAAPGEPPAIEFSRDGVAMAPPPDVGRLLTSIAQDLGGIPETYLVPAGDGDYRPAAPTANPADDARAGIDHAHGVFLYPEWDMRRRHYRKQWCVVRERDVHPGEADFVAKTLARHAFHVARLRRSFELLRGEDRLLKRQPGGDAIDIDAVVDGFADVAAGRELPERLFVRRLKAERNLAALFMVDMSGSTRGWINDAEREALVLLAEALGILGDRYAIYGFSGITRKRCEIYRVKRFDEPYDDTVRRRIAGIAPQDYTRMGAAIRHLTRILEGVDARTRLLVTLSDGKPDDYGDDYRGEYGIEDTRQALTEARRAGIHPFCITIDREARDYLPHMYGAANYTVIDDIAQLPLRVAGIYRRLTT